MNWKRSSFCSSGGCVEVAWKTSSFCASNGCVEVAWTRSSYCANGACVEVGHESGRVLVRDSKAEQSRVLSFQPSEWMNTVLAPVMLGRTPSMVHHVGRGVEWRGHDVDGHDERLFFDSDEWDAFRRGVEAGQFDVEALTR